MKNDWLQTLDAGLARLNRSRDWPAYHAGRAEVLAALAAKTDAASPEIAACLLKLSRSADGYLRQAAVRQLGSQDCSEKVFIALIERLNDWVPNVRRAAHAAIDGFLQAPYLPTILAGLPALLALSLGRREDHGPLMKRLSALLVGALASETGRAAVLEDFAARRGRLARFFFAQISSAEGESRHAVLAAAATHGDFLIRQRAAEALAADFPHPQSEPPAYAAVLLGTLLGTLLADRNAGVRRRALHTLLSAADAKRRRVLIERFLLDEALSVREEAWWWAKMEAIDTSAFLAERLNGGHAPSPASLWLIAALKEKRYLPLIRRSFLDGGPRLRRAALAAWLALERESLDQALMRALSDPANKIAHLAFRLLDSGEAALANAQFEAAATACWQKGLRERCAQVARCLPKPEHLSLVLSFAAEGCAAHEAALPALDAMLRQCAERISHTYPTPLAPADRQRLYAQTLDWSPNEALAAARAELLRVLNEKK